MNTTTKTQTATLPVTGRDIAAAVQADYTVKGYKSMLTVDGLADTANLYRGTRKVAAIQQDGNGGMTFARFDAPAERDRFEEATGGDVEATLDALMLEALATREVKKHARKYLLVVPADGDVLDYKAFRKMPLDDALRGALVLKFGQGTRVWDGQGWATV